MKMIGELMVFGYTTMKMRTFSKSVLLGILIRDWAEDVESGFDQNILWKCRKVGIAGLQRNRQKFLPETGFGKLSKWKY